jgi:hypothetical protein
VELLLTLGATVSVSVALLLGRRRRADPGVAVQRPHETVTVGRVEA